MDAVPAVTGKGYQKPYHLNTHLLLTLLLLLLPDLLSGFVVWHGVAHFFANDRFKRDFRMPGEMDYQHKAQGISAFLLWAR